MTVRYRVHLYAAGRNLILDNVSQVAGLFAAPVAEEIKRVTDMGKVFILPDVGSVMAFDDEDPDYDSQGQYVGEVKWENGWTP